MSRCKWLKTNILAPSFVKKFTDLSICPQRKRMRLKVGAKIALGFGVILLILFIMGGYSYYKAAELDA